MMIKIIVDALMLFALIFEFSKIYSGSLLHEIFGVTLLVLMITHLFLNRSYIKNIFKCKYNISNLVLLIVNIFVFLSIIVSITCGILISEVLFKNFSKYNINISRIHIISSYLAIMMVSLHLGFNLKTIIGKIKLFNNKFIYIPLQLIIVCLGIYSLIKTKYFSYLFGLNYFFSKDSNIYVNLFLYWSISMFFVIIMYNINNVFFKNK